MRHDGSADAGEPLPRVQVRAYEARCSTSPSTRPLRTSPGSTARSPTPRGGARSCSPPFASLPTARATLSWPQRRRRTGCLTARWRMGPTRARHVDPTPEVRPSGGGTYDAVPAPHARYGKPGRGQSATRDEAEGSDGARSPQEKE